MKNIDTIQRFIFEQAHVRGEIVRLEQSFQSIVDQHQYPPVIRRILGEMLAAASLLSAIIKFSGRLTVQFQGKGPVKLLIAQCTEKFELRGLAQCQADLSEEELMSALQQGTLAIMISPDNTTTSYQGIVAWEGNSLAQSLEGYFRHSEQLPTRVWLAINDTTAAGLLLQTMPESSTVNIANNHHWEHLIHLSDTITPAELLTLDNQTLLHRLYSQEDVRLFESSSIVFRCTCSKERCENAIRMLGKQEAEEELAGKQVIAVTCEFCNKEFSFDREAVEHIFQQNDQPPTDQVH